jgi:hypothetical protein
MTESAKTLSYSIGVQLLHANSYCTMSCKWLGELSSGVVKCNEGQYTYKKALP